MRGRFCCAQPDMALALDGGHRIGRGGVEVIEDKILGQGSYGVVYEARYYGAPVAAKRLHSIFFEAGTSTEGMAGMLDNFSHEWSLLRRLKHPNVVEFFGVYCPALKDSGDDPKQSFEVDGECFIICELLAMSLQDRICLKPSLNFRQSVDISLQIASGLRYLHERVDPIMHRDLAAKNVLLSHSGEAKIADLGVAKVVGYRGKEKTFTRHPGTDSYMPVEVRLANADYDESIDVFALGVIILELCISRLSVPSEPFIMAESVVQVIPELKRREFDFETLHQQSVSKPLEKIIYHCLEEKKVRPTAKEVSMKLIALKASQDYRSIPVVPVIDSGLQSQHGLSVETLQQETQSLKMLLRDRELRVQELAAKISSEQAMKDATRRKLDEASRRIDELQAADNFKQTRIAELEADVRMLAQQTKEKAAEREVDMRRSSQHLTRMGSIPSQGDRQQPMSGFHQSGSYQQQQGSVPSTTSLPGGQFKPYSGIHNVGGRRTELVVSGPSIPFSSIMPRERSAPRASYALSQYPPSPQPYYGDEYSTPAASNSYLLSTKGETYPSYSMHQPALQPPLAVYGEDTLTHRIKQPPEARPSHDQYPTYTQPPSGMSALHPRGTPSQVPPSSGAAPFSIDEESGVIPRSIHLAESPAPIQGNGAELEVELIQFKRNISNLVPASKASDRALVEQARAIRLQGGRLKQYLEASGYYKEASRLRDRVDDEVVPHQLQLQKECDKMLRTVHYIMGCSVTGDECLLHAARSLVDSGAPLLASITA